MMTRFHKDPTLNLSPRFFLYCFAFKLKINGCLSLNEMCCVLGWMNEYALKWCSTKNDNSVIIYSPTHYLLYPMLMELPWFHRRRNFTWPSIDMDVCRQWLNCHFWVNFSFVDWQSELKSVTFSSILSNYIVTTKASFFKGGGSRDAASSQREGWRFSLWFQEFACPLCVVVSLPRGLYSETSISLQPQSGVSVPVFWIF